MTIPKPVVTSFTTVGGYYLTAEGGGGREVMADRPVTSDGPGPWELWTVHTYDDGRVSLQAHDGHFLTAELDDTVRARATESGEWERFTFEVRDVGVAFLSFHGKYLCAEGGRGGSPVADRVPRPPPPGGWGLLAAAGHPWPPVGINSYLLIGPWTRTPRMKAATSSCETGKTSA